MTNASIVLFNSDQNAVKNLINQFLASSCSNIIYLIDNSPTNNMSFLSKVSPKVKYIHTNKNLGYGAAHNIAINKSLENNISFHLVLNPDIKMESQTVDQIFHFMIKNSEVGLVMPKILYPDGTIQYLCKKLPRPIDLFLRFFTPHTFMKSSKENFFLKKTGYNKIMNIPYLSGCFMFLNIKAIKMVGTFDNRFFMYAEDIDLSRRIHSKFKTIFFPDVSVIHVHEKASSKKIKMAVIHALSVIRYFNKWGWIYDKERNTYNSKLRFYEKESNNL